MKFVPYVVRPGDYLVKLAQRMGFDADDAWNAKENEPLRKLGRTPHMLFAGDVLYIPQVEPQWRGLATGSVNTFVSERPGVKIHARFATGDKAWANEAYTVEGAELPDGNLDGDGNFNGEVPTDVSAIVLEFAKRRARFTLRVGNLDPITTDSGVKQRLTHMGFLPRNAIATRIHEDGMHSRAVASFQESKGLPVTGVADQATRDAIVAAHGS
jgi:hypothetical protein